MIYSTEMVLKNGLMVPNMKENMFRDVNKVKVSIHMLIRVFMRVNGLRIRYKVWGHIHGKMGRYIQESGKEIICMGKGCLIGLTEEVMKESIMMIRKKDLEYIHGQMVDNTQDNG